MVYFWVAGWSRLNLTLHGKGKAYSALGITANPLFGFAASKSYTTCEHTECSFSKGSVTPSKVGTVGVGGEVPPSVFGDTSAFL